MYGHLNFKITIDTALFILTHSSQSFAVTIHLTIQNVKRDKLDDKQFNSEQRRSSEGSAVGSFSPDDSFFQFASCRPHRMKLVEHMVCVITWGISDDNYVRKFCCRSDWFTRTHYRGQQEINNKNKKFPKKNKQNASSQR